MQLEDYFEDKEKLKEWIPIYGFFKYYFNPKTMKRMAEGRLPKKDPVLGSLWGMYHGFFFAGTIIGLYVLFDNLF